MIFDTVREWLWPTAHPETPPPEPSPYTAPCGIPPDIDDRPIKVDVHGMNPRTHKYEKRMSQDGKYHGEIIVIVPLTFLRGYSDRCYDNLRFAISYEITETKFANHVDLVKISAVNRDYETPTDNVQMAMSHHTVTASITQALSYFYYVTEWLRANKDHPAPFERADLWANWEHDGRG